ncbi:MAG TPA: tubulin-like doman-containing protein [Thermoanaerobaculia bacterium]|nr:tubulin-like doman-containing protein [Thermoanaerobaculia bacterium]
MTTRHRKLVVDELLTKPSAIAPMLFVGLGGCGCRMVARVAKHLHRRPDWHERYQKLIKFALIDTNINDLETYREIADETFLISDFEKEEYAKLASGKLFLEADPYFTQWVPQDYRFRAGDTAGAGQIRIESRLGVFYQMKHKDFILRFRQLLEDLKSHELGHRRLDSSEIRIVLCYSVAGGTGSGCHLPLAYVLRDLAADLGKPQLFGVAVMPAVFEDKTRTNKDGTFANGYAALKETEHLMRLGAPDSRFYPEDGLPFHYNPADPSRRSVRDRPFEFVYLVDKPQSFSVPDVVAAAADGLYLQFFSPLFARQAGDYDNYTQHQRFLVPHDFEGKGIQGFSTFYGSYGAAVLLVPVDGLVEYCSQAAALSLMQASFLRGIPGDPVYQPLRTHREPFDEVTEQDGPNERPIHLADLHKKEPAKRAVLRNRLFMKRVRLLAACEVADSMEKRFLSLFRHGHRLGERPTMAGGVELREDQVKPDLKLLADHGTSFSIGALVLDALDGEQAGQVPGLVKAARKGVEELADDRKLQARDGHASDFVRYAEALVEDLFREGRRRLEDGYKRGTLAYPGLEVLVSLDFLRDEAGGVELAAKRYAVLCILQQVGWERQPPEPHGDWDLGERTVDSKVKQNVSQQLIDSLTDQAIDRAMERVERHFVERLGDLRDRLRELAAIQHNLDQGFEELEREARRRLDDLRQRGDDSANQYVLDAEALQVEDGRRLWDFYYEDKITPLAELSLGDKRVQQVLSDTVADLALAGGARSTNSATLDKLFTSLRTHAVTVLRPRVGGDPHASDRERREGLTLAEALELEVTYRALYRSHQAEVETQDGSKVVRRLVAEYRALPPERQIDLEDTRHQDYLRDKIKRVVKEKASLLCVYEGTRDQHGGVRPDDVFLAAISADFRNSTIEKTLRKTEIAGLEWVTDGWHDPKEIIFYRARLNVPLYVFGRLPEMKEHYYRFKHLAKRPKVLHIDHNWEDTLPDLDPDSSQEEHRQQLVRQQIINFAALLTIPRDGDGSTCIDLVDGTYSLFPPTAASTGNGSAPEARVTLGERMTQAIEHLPEVLQAEKVKYLSYQQTLKAVREGMAPEVLRRITRLPFLWRQNHDELKQQYGTNPGQAQRERLKDYTDSYSRLQESLDKLLEKLANREIEQRTLGEAPHQGNGRLPSDPAENLRQSIEILRAFSETWQLMEDPERAGEVPPSFAELFLPLSNADLQETLSRLRSAFGAQKESATGRRRPPSGTAGSGSPATTTPPAV